MNVFFSAAEFVYFYNDEECIKPWMCIFCVCWRLDLKMYVSFVDKNRSAEYTSISLILEQIMKLLLV